MQDRTETTHPIPAASTCLAGADIARRAQKLGLDSQNLADATGLTQLEFMQSVTGQRQFSPAEIEGLAQLLGCTTAGSARRVRTAGRAVDTERPPQPGPLGPR